MQEMGIESTLVEAINSGEKTIEARLGKPKFLKIHEDDIISVREDLWLGDEVINSFPDAVRIKITQVLYFESFEDMLNAVDHQAAVPSAKTVADALKTYRKYYSEADEAEYGVVAFYFEVTE